MVGALNKPLSAEMVVRIAIIVIVLVHGLLYCAANTPENNIEGEAFEREPCR